MYPVSNGLLAFPPRIALVPTTAEEEEAGCEAEERCGGRRGAGRRYKGEREYQRGGSRNEGVIGKAG